METLKKKISHLTNLRQIRSQPGGTSLAKLNRPQQEPVTSSEGSLSDWRAGNRGKVRVQVAAAKVKLVQEATLAQPCLHAAIVR